MKAKICILDYGSGNVASVHNAVSRLADSTISNRKIDILRASHIILPGVGAFGAAMEKINSKLPLDTLFTEIGKGKPLLGICVGAQVLMEFGEEQGNYAGLALIEGSVGLLDSNGLRLPHIGWNNVSPQGYSPLLKDINEIEDFYFVHSYAVNRINKDSIIATTEYGSQFPSIFFKENVFGVQFHPEKSQKAGLKLLSNFADLQC